MRRSDKNDLPPAFAASSFVTADEQLVAWPPGHEAGATITGALSMNELRAAFPGYGDASPHHVSVVPF